MQNILICTIYRDIYIYYYIIIYTIYGCYSQICISIAKSSGVKLSKAARPRGTGAVPLTGSNGLKARHASTKNAQAHGHVVPRGHEPHPILQLLESAPVQQVLCIVEPQGVFCQENTNEI